MEGPATGALVGAEEPLNARLCGGTRELHVRPPWYHTLATYTKLVTDGTGAANAY